MKVELFDFQTDAVSQLRMLTADALGDYRKSHTPQVVSFTAPTGAGKTIIMASLIEDIFFGDDIYADQQDAIFIWLSDSPQLNKQSKEKIDTKADRIRLGQCIMVEDDSFDQEMFDDGYIYFLNTQKLGKSSNLTKHGDSRTYTIWETLANTAREKSDRLYFIIDEAHRGMQGKDARKATTIMQKFLKGSYDDKINPMPVVIGMSATMERFNTLVEGTTSTVRKCIITADQVRASGLLKDRIIISYPDAATAGKEMAVLQAAADDWKEKWDHWTLYCREQHYAYVNPVFVVQVSSGKGDKISETDLDDCLEKIEERTGFLFEPGEVVHTFGQTNSSISVNGLEVRYVEPSEISDDRKIKVVFFKENLSTGWDCPRAETMMSFRHAVDATYIAQLLGRMVRTPMQMHIQVDDVLNDVHLFLPYFDADTVKQVVKELQSTEGSKIPADIYEESPGKKKLDTLTIHPKKASIRSHSDKQVPNQMDLSDFIPDWQDKTSDSADTVIPNFVSENNLPEETESSSATAPAMPLSAPLIIKDHTVNYTGNKQDEESKQEEQHTIPVPANKEPEPVQDYFDREEVVRFINDAGLLSYEVRNIQRSSYLSSLLKMIHLLSQSGLYPSAINDVHGDIVQMIHDYVEDLKAANKYDELVTQLMQFELQVQIFDVFGESVDNYTEHAVITSTDTDIDRQYRLAESKLGSDGIGNDYGKTYADWSNPNAFMIDVILFAADPECISKLNTYAEAKFHELNDDYRRLIATVDSDKIQRQYNNIVSDGDIISKHNFRLPETITVPHDSDGKVCSDHLFVDEDTGIARIKLNSWEEGTLDEERKREDFVCWIRNPSRASWALTIPYQYDGVMKSAYPDLIIVRKDDKIDYVVDILEPHMPKYDDNLGKAKGFAEYARQNPGIGRIQLIRESTDSAGQKRFKRLDMSKSSTRKKVMDAYTQDELNHIFDTDGFFE